MASAAQLATRFIATVGGASDWADPVFHPASCRLLANTCSSPPFALATRCASQKTISLVCCGMGGRLDVLVGEAVLSGSVGG